MPRNGESIASPMHRGVLVALTATAVWNVAGAASALLAPLCAAPADYCGTLLTAVLAALTLALATGARTLERPELRWLAWLFAAVVTAKVLLQDLHQAQTLAVVLSLLIYGSDLILLPKLLGGRPPEGAAEGRIVRTT
jgi:hypothetical protein